MGTALFITTASEFTLTLTRQANIPILSPPEKPTEIGPASVAPYALSLTYKYNHI